jgi:hypothetical protein
MEEEARAAGSRHEEGDEPVSLEEAWSLLMLALILLIGLCLILTYKLGYKNGQAAKVAHVLESILEGIEKHDAVEQRKPKE